MTLLEQIFEKAKKEPKRVAFPEAENEKILRAVCECRDKGICVPVLVGDPSRIQEAAKAFGTDIDGIEIINATDESMVDAAVEEYADYGNRGFSQKTIRRRCADYMYVALVLQAIGRVDVMFAGIEYSTGDVIRAGQMVIGIKEGITGISSIGIFNTNGSAIGEDGYLAFGDSSVIVDPTPEQLASIAITSCDTVRALCGWEPRCAMLSYSTCGSAKSQLVNKVLDGIKIANEQRPDLAIDGEFQLDAALSPAVAAKKVGRESGVAGKANIIIWPDINSGNIGVKLVQLFGGYEAYGPMLQGFKKVVSDCSRSASVEDMIGNIAMNCVRAQEEK